MPGPDDQIHLSDDARGFARDPARVATPGTLPPPRPLESRVPAGGARAFFASEDASTAIEFATLAPVFVWLSLMVVQIGLYFYNTATLQRGADAAIRQILVGNVANSNLTSAQFLNQTLCPQLPSFTCSNIVVNLIEAPTDFYSLTNKATNAALPLGYSLSGLTAPPLNNNQTSFCIGGNGSVIVAEIFYAMPVIGIPAFSSSATLNGQSIIWIQADSVFKNEPFNTSYSGC